MNKKNSFIVDGVIWIFVMILAAIIAFNLLQRDKERQFGAIAYGGFPQFSIMAASGEVFDYHRIKKAVWAIHQGAGVRSKEVSQQLNSIANSTASGKRYMHVLTFAPSPDVFINTANQFHIIVHGTVQQLDKIFSKFGLVNEDKVFLVDQDGVIRGQYDFSSPDDFRSFRQDLLRIL